jgi:hypothetical protein
MYSVTSQFIVSIIGNAVIEPLPLGLIALTNALATLYLAMYHLVLPALSNIEA